MLCSEREIFAASRFIICCQMVRTHSGAVEHVSAEKRALDQEERQAAEQARKQQEQEQARVMLLIANRACFESSCNRPYDLFFVISRDRML